MVVLGTINLPLVLGDEKHKRELYVKFKMVDIPFAYNVILDRLVLNYHGIFINMGAMCLKLPAPRGLVVNRGNQKSPKNATNTPQEASEKRPCPSTY